MTYNGYKPLDTFFLCFIFLRRAELCFSKPRQNCACWSQSIPYGVWLGFMWGLVLIIIILIDRVHDVVFVLVLEGDSITFSLPVHPY
jgi:hypothetical protein